MFFNHSISLELAIALSHEAQKWQVYAVMVNTSYLVIFLGNSGIFC